MIHENFVIESSVLTTEEERCRDFMLFVFNPVLKTLIMQYNDKDFRRWGFNSCRQTAIFGAFFLEKMLPNYDIEVKGIYFDDVLFGEKTKYTHYIDIATCGDRTITIDISRTIKRLIFHVIENDTIYPNEHEYAHITPLMVYDIDWRYYINDVDEEYLTKMSPDDILTKLLQMIQNAITLPDAEFTAFYRYVYALTTAFGPFIYREDQFNDLRLQGGYYETYPGIQRSVLDEYKGYGSYHSGWIGGSGASERSLEDGYKNSAVS